MDCNQLRQVAPQGNYGFDASFDIYHQGTLAERMLPFVHQSQNAAMMRGRDDLISIQRQHMQKRKQMAEPGPSSFISLEQYKNLNNQNLRLASNGCSENFPISASQVPVPMSDTAQQIQVVAVPLAPGTAPNPAYPTFQLIPVAALTENPPLLPSAPPNSTTAALARCVEAIGSISSTISKSSKGSEREVECVKKGGKVTHRNSSGKCEQHLTREEGEEEEEEEEDDEIENESDDDGDEEERAEERNCNTSDYPRFRDYQKDQWTMKFDELVEYRKRFGHCLVHHTYTENLPLTRWVKRQRYQYKLLLEGKNSTLTKDRVAALEAIDFVWDSQGTTWFDHLADLQDFKAIHGHCNVPSKWDKNPKLATWVKCQRKQYRLFKNQKPSNMTQTRILELEKIGFQWISRKGKHANVQSSIQTRNVLP